MRCPICREEASPERSIRPFCSSRCRTVDLGNWVDGAYRIPTALPPSDQDERQGDDLDAN